MDPNADVEGTAAPVGGDEAAVGEEGSAELSMLSLPISGIKRIAQSAAPGARFSSESIAALHRVAQSYVLWATDRSLAHSKAADAQQQKGKKVKFAPAPAVGRRLAASHVMSFLSAELPQIANRVASLFPDAMPTECKPSSVQLLEQYREQERNRAAGFALGGQDGPAGSEEATTTKRTAVASEEPPAKRPKAGTAADKAKAAATPSLKGFFSKKPAAPQAAPVAQCAPPPQVEEETTPPKDEAEEADTVPAESMELAANV